MRESGGVTERDASSCLLHPLDHDHAPKESERDLEWRDGSRHHLCHKVQSPVLPEQATDVCPPATQGPCLARSSVRAPFWSQRPESRPLSDQQKAKVSYRNAGGNKDDDSDDDGRPKKKVKVDPKLAINQAKEVDDDGVPLGELNIIKKFPTFEKREKETVFKQPSVWRRFPHSLAPH